MSKNCAVAELEWGGLLGSQSLVAERNASEHSSVTAELTSIVQKVLVGIPLKGHTPPRSYHDRMMMWQYLGSREAKDFYEHKNPRYSFQLGAIGELLVPYARERLAEGALELGAQWLLMIDDDMLCPHDLFFKLVDNDKDICAPLAFTRNPNHKPVAYETREGFDETTRTRYGFTRYIENYPRNTLFECDAVGFGAVLIKTDVLKKIPKPWFFGMAQTGEDVTLCTKARRAGFRVWMDSRIKLGHLSDPIVVTEEYSDMWNKLTPEQREKQYGDYLKYKEN